MTGIMLHCIVKEVTLLVCSIVQRKYLNCDNACVVGHRGS